MWFLKKTIAVHNGGYHADDVFACATLSLFLKGNIKIIRTRDEKLIEKADFVIDVGGIYDSEQNRFDHHQVGGAGVRDNGIPYASFGLVWKEYGTLVCGSEEIANTIETRLVLPIDAIDNGVSLIKEAVIYPYTINDVLSSIDAEEDSNEKEQYKAFTNAVTLAQEIISGEIRKLQVLQIKKKMILEAYEKSESKEILVLDQYVSRYDLNSVLSEKPDILFCVLPRGGDSGWRIETIKSADNDFLPRKKFPESWAGLKDEELQKVSGVADAIFCHNARFLCITKSKSGAEALALKALGI